MNSSAHAGSVLAHISPHPDDEALGSPGVVLAMHGAGWHVVNFVATMGRPEHRERRSGEAASAAQVLDLELRSPFNPVGLSKTDDLELGYELIRSELRNLFDELRPKIVVAPSPHDGHHAHELVGRAVLSVLEHIEDRPRLWLWGLWSDLPFPTIYAPYGEDVMRRAQRTIRCYVGELQRNDYSALLASRARANAILGIERVFGFGETRTDGNPYADLLMECLPRPVGWMLGQGRVLEPKSEPVECSAVHDIGWWLASTSPHEKRRIMGRRDPRGSG
jgi:LmbE family N-acetylglucosaminyl deacetylase